eukprot:m.228504 g.228504  ORF g.228504 m.228504 type:complete len:592 (+) comp11753_c0_seq1:212-1987(+)
MFRRKSSEASVKAETLVRKGNFMTKPDKGWLHNDELLSAGNGIYYCFPVRYIGSLQVLASLNALSMEEKTELCREAIARTMETAKIRKKGKRKNPKYFKQYIADTPYVKVMEIKLNISSDGIATSDSQTSNVLSNDAISRISFATGGEREDYPLITYVAKDKRENRYCHVFDCGALADDVLATIGQVFTLTSTPSKPDNKPNEVLAAVAGPASNPMYFQRGASMKSPYASSGAPPPPGSARPGGAARRGSEESVYGDDNAPMDFDKRRPSVRSDGYSAGDGGYLGEIANPGGPIYDTATARAASVRQPPRGDGGYLSSPAIYDRAGPGGAGGGDAGYLQMPGGAGGAGGGDAGYLAMPGGGAYRAGGDAGYLQMPSGGAYRPPGAGGYLDVAGKPPGAGAYLDVAGKPAGAGGYLDVSGKPGAGAYLDVAGKPPGAGAYLDVAGKPPGAGGYLDVAGRQPSDQYLSSPGIYDDGSHGPGGAHAQGHYAGRDQYLDNTAVYTGLAGDDQYIADPRAAYPGDSGYLQGAQIYESLGQVPSDELIRIANEKFQSNRLYEDDPDRGNIYGDGKTCWNYLKTEGVERSLADLALGK